MEDTTKECWMIPITGSKELPFAGGQNRRKIRFTDQSEPSETYSLAVPNWQDARAAPWPIEHMWIERHPNGDLSIMPFNERPQPVFDSTTWTGLKV